MSILSLDSAHHTRSHLIKKIKQRLGTEVSAFDKWMKLGVSTLAAASAALKPSERLCRNFGELAQAKHLHSGWHNAIPYRAKKRVSINR